MYTLSKGTTKFHRTLSRGYTQPLERLERKDLDSRREPFGPAEMNSAPKVVFNGRGKHSAVNQNMSSNRITQEPFSPQHEEMVRFVADGWHRVQHEYEISSRQGKEGGPIMYQEKVAAPMRDFEAFDIDRWASKRAIQKMHMS